MWKHLLNQNILDYFTTTNILGEREQRLSHYVTQTSLETHVLMGSFSISQSSSVAVIIGAYYHA